MQVKIHEIQWWMPEQREKGKNDSSNQLRHFNFRSFLKTNSHKKEISLSLFQLSLYSSSFFLFFFLINFPLKFGLFLFSAFLGCLKIYFYNILSKSTASLCHNWKVLVYKDVISVSQIHHTTSKCLIVTFSICLCCLIFSEEAMSFIEIQGKKWVEMEEIFSSYYSWGAICFVLITGSCSGQNQRRKYYLCWVLRAEEDSIF